ncbi:MAG: SgcJ/EcaC family oxidoreductase [Gemmatimonadota bacterium]
MDRDEQAIRDLVETWMQASLENDLETVLGLMSDDVVFLGSGRPPMRGKNAFAVATKSVESAGRIEGKSDIQEIRVMGDWACCWNQLRVVMHPAGGGKPVVREGPVLSILQRQRNGKWVIIRDANMLAVVPS